MGIISPDFNSIIKIKNKGLGKIVEVDFFCCWMNGSISILVSLFSVNPE